MFYVLQEHKGSIFPVWLQNQSITSWKDPIKLRISVRQIIVLEATKLPSTDQLYFHSDRVHDFSETGLHHSFCKEAIHIYELSPNLSFEKYQQIQLFLLLGKERLKKAHKNY